MADHGSRVAVRGGPIPSDPRGAQPSGLCRHLHKRRGCACTAGRAVQSAIRGERGPVTCGFPPVQAVHAQRGKALKGAQRPETDSPLPCMHSLPGGPGEAPASPRAPLIPSLAAQSWNQAP